MKDKQFRVLLDLMMVSDPWPLAEKGSHEVFVELLHNEARNRGYDDEIVAYHVACGGAPANKVKIRKPRKKRGTNK